MSVYGSSGIKVGLFGYFVEIVGILISKAKNPKTLIMGDKSVNEPRDPTKERFSRLEEQVTVINHNVNLLMIALSHKLRIFGEEGGLNAKDKSEGGLGDPKDVDN